MRKRKSPNRGSSLLREEGSVLDENEFAIRMIRQAIDECLFEPGYHWSPDMFEERSYARWAAFEILERLMDQPFDDPEVVVSKFMYKMGVLASEERDPKRVHLFMIARDTAHDILSIIT